MRKTAEIPHVLSVLRKFCGRLLAGKSNEGAKENAVPGRVFGRFCGRLISKPLNSLQMLPPWFTEPGSVDPLLQRLHKVQHGARRRCYTTALRPLPSGALHGLPCLAAAVGKIVGEEKGGVNGMVLWSALTGPAGRVTRPQCRRQGTRRGRRTAAPPAGRRRRAAGHRLRTRIGSFVWPVGCSDWFGCSFA
jgi:hypothetical protein